MLKLRGSNVKNEKSHVKKFFIFQLFVNFSTDSDSSAIKFFRTGSKYAYTFIKKILKKPKEVQIHFEVPKNLAKYVVKKGSIAIDGISLTVVDIKKTLASVSLIPHTIEITNFHTKKVGDKVNIETDILGKYILKQG